MPIRTIDTKTFEGEQIQCTKFVSDEPFSMRASELIATLSKEAADKVIAADTVQGITIPLPETFYENMFALFNAYDPETAHIEADKMMCELLRSLGYGKAVDYFEEQERWYS